MATQSLRFLSRRPVVAGAAITAVVGAGYLASRPKLRLDSTYHEPTKCLSFPKTMLFSQQLTVSGVEQINHDTKRITCTLPGGQEQISGVPAGGAILTQHKPQQSFFPVFRPYTPIHDLDEPGVLQLLVKKYPNGRASGHLHSLQQGDTLTVRGPLPGYSWKPSKDSRQVLLVAGGAGITPIYSLTKGILTDTRDTTKIELVWGVNGTRDIVLGRELEELEKRFPGRLRVTYAVSGPEGLPDTPSFGDEQRYKKGYVNESVLREAVGRIESQGSWGTDADKKVFLCGPPAFETAMTGKSGVLAALGIRSKDVHRF